MLIEFKRHKTFALQELNQLLPVIARITRDYKQSVELKMQRLDQLVGSKAEHLQELEKGLDVEIEEWKTKMSKLGGVPSGLWMLDFDSGDGYYCWKFPEPEVLYWHRHHEGFTNRISVTEKTACLNFPSKKDH